MSTAIAPDGQLGVIDRIKAAGQVLINGTTDLINPLASVPKEKSRGELVKELNQWCLDSRSFWKPTFDLIRQEQRFAAGKQWPKAYVTQVDFLEPYVGDVIQQMLNRKTATLYAKNPTPEANRRETMQFTVWDGTQQSLEGAKATVATAMALKQQAVQLVQQGQQVPPPPPEAEQQVASAQAIIADYDKGMMQNALMDKIAKTATLLLKREWELQTPDLIVSMKQLVTRVLTSRVGYIKVIYRREGESPNTVEATVNTLADDIQAMKYAIQRMSQPDFDPDSAEAQKFKLLAQSTQEAQNPAVNLPQDEGVILDFPSATSIIVDRNCKCLREFVGAKRIAHEVLMPVRECEEKYDISLKGAGAVLYADDGTVAAPKGSNKLKPSDDDYAAKNRSKVCVWEIQDKETGAIYTVSDGVRDFLKDPEPNEPMVKRFWNLVPVVFNCQEVEVNDPDQDVTIYPRSDVRLAMPMAIDINTSGEGLREHRTANRPGWVGVASRFSSNTGQNDLQKLTSPRSANTVLMIDSLNPGEKISDFIQPIPTLPIKPEMYSNEQSMEAMLQATGMQASDIGQQAPNEKATGQQIAAQQKATTDGSNIDDLDFALSTVAQMMWEQLIQEMPAATVKKLIGPAAAWPDIPGERLKTMNEIYLSIEAGSSGRPNQMLKTQQFKDVAPKVAEYLEAGGYDMEEFVKYGLSVLDPDIDLDQFLKLKQPQGPPGAGEKVSESISIKLTDLSPEERAQALANANIKAGGVVPQPKPVSKPAATNP